MRSALNLTLSAAVLSLASAATAWSANTDPSLATPCSGATGRAFELCVDNLASRPGIASSVQGPGLNASSACSGRVGRAFELCVDDLPALADARPSSASGAGLVNIGGSCAGLTGRRFELCVDDHPAAEPPRAAR